MPNVSNSLERTMPNARVDAAHPVDPDVSQRNPGIGDSAVRAVPATDEPDAVGLQASQIAAHLRSKQRELERREAHLNSQLAKLEQEQRTSRLWLREKAHEFAERDKELAARAAELEQQAGQFAAVQHADNRDSADLDLRLNRREQHLAQWQKKLEAQETRLRAQAHEAVTKAQDLEQRQLRLRDSESLLAEQFDDVEKDRERVRAEQTRFQKAAEKERSDFEQQKRQATVVIQQAREKLDERTKGLGNREATLGQLHDECAKLQRESLEMRLVTELMWSKIAERIDGAELTQSVSQLRAQMADHYRLAGESLAEQKAELQQLAANLKRRQQELEQQRRDVQQWCSRRNEEIEQQAARLVAREHELERQDQDAQRQLEDWFRERRRYQQQILDLTRRLESRAAA